MTQTHIAYYIYNIDMIIVNLNKIIDGLKHFHLNLNNYKGIYYVSIYRWKCCRVSIYRDIDI